MEMTEGERHQQVTEPDWSGDEDELLPAGLDSRLDLMADSSANKEEMPTEDASQLLAVTNKGDSDELPIQDEDDAGDEDSYNIGDYDGMNVTPEIKEIFQYITKYRPQILALEIRLKPFIPDYIPAVGDPDAFLKVDRPDGKEETLGLYNLDEPSLCQSDPSVLDLKLRSIYKQTTAKAVRAKTVLEPNKTKAIDKWISDINELHRSKPLPTVTYTKPLPDIDTLLGEWPAEVEEVILKENGMPPPDLDCDLASYVDIACGLLDIPVYTGNRIQSLHLLLTLYSEMGRLQK